MSPFHTWVNYNPNPNPNPNHNPNRVSIHPCWISLGPVYEFSTYNFRQLGIICTSRKSKRPLGLVLYIWVMFCAVIIPVIKTLSFQFARVGDPIGIEEIQVPPPTGQIRNAPWKCVSPVLLHFFCEYWEVPVGNPRLIHLQWYCCNFNLLHCLKIASL